MRLFVTGGTGAVGRPVVTALKSRNHEILALARSDANQQILQDLGARPVSADLYDEQSLFPYLDECDAIVHMATKIPKTANLNNPYAWAENDRIRKVGTNTLVNAALRTRSVKTFVYPSVFFMYTDQGEYWQTAETATLDPPEPLESTLFAEQSVSRFAAESNNHRGTVLRFGSFYGPQSRESREILKMARRGAVMPLATISAYRTMIWIDDAASAIVAALQDTPGGIYDVAEDEPYTQAQAIKAIAKAVGKKKLFKLPRFLLRFGLEPNMRALLERSQRINSDRFREATGWTASVPNQDIGWALIAASGQHNEQLMTTLK